MAYPTDYSPETGVIGSTLQTPSHIGAHQAIADWIAAAEPHIGLATGTWTPVYTDNGTTKGTTNAGRYRRMGNHVTFDITLSGGLLSLGSTGYKLVTLPFDMRAGSPAPAGFSGTFFLNQSAGSTFMTAGLWFATREAGLGNNVLRLQDTDVNYGGLDYIWVSGHYEAV